MKKESAWMRSPDEVQLLLDTRDVRCEQMALVMDNFNTHAKGVFYETFDPTTARGGSNPLLVIVV